MYIYFEKTEEEVRGKVPFLWISPDYPVPQYTHPIPQTTVLIRLGLALGFALGGLAVPGGPEACSGPWGEVGWVSVGTVVIGGGEGGSRIPLVAGTQGPQLHLLLASSVGGD